MKEVCKNCKYQRGNFDYYVGSPCRRYPPKMVVVDEVVSNQFCIYTKAILRDASPMIFPDNFCGEFKPKKK